MAEDAWLSNWAELSGDGGLTSKHWRTRLAALQSLLVLADQSTLPNGAPPANLLDLLIFTLALSDTHCPVRKSAVECASKIFQRMHNHLSVTELDRYLLGFFAVSVDHEMEVHSVAAKALLDSSVRLGSQWLKEMIPRVIYKFVSSSLLHSVRTLQKMPRATNFDESSNLIDMDVMVPAVEGIIHAEQLCKSVSMPEAINLEIGLHLMSLLVTALAALLEEYEISRDRLGVSQVSHLLRSLGSAKYRQHIIFMISSQSYEGAYLARLHKTSAFVTDELVELLGKMDSLVVLKGIIVVLEGNSPHQVSKSPDENNVEAGALRYIIKYLQIPSPLVVAIHEARDKIEEEKFVNSSYYYLRVAEAILKQTSLDMNHIDVVQDLVLSCSALASTDNGTLTWITRDIRELACDIMRHLGAMFTESTQPARTVKLKIDTVPCVERLILRMLPDLIPKLKSQLRDQLSKNGHINSETCSSSASLASAIIAAHKLCWCLKQVFHPHLSQSCILIMPCALMALDHYSPHVKRQAMILFIHLTENLNPSELRWYKDAILDCITRNIVGCGELWPLVVQTAIPLVLCIEGNNPRAIWYKKILNEMLGELERHHLDANRFKVWLENVVKLLEAMGLVLIAHFKRILPLLFPWLHTSDSSMTLLVLNIFKVIVKHTWPRMPFHIDRFWKELEEVYNESANKEKGLEIRSSVIDVAQLLQLSGGAAFDLVWQKERSNPTSLGFALAHHLSQQTRELEVS